MKSLLPYKVTFFGSGNEGVDILGAIMPPTTHSIWHYHSIIAKIIIIIPFSQTLHSDEQKIFWALHLKYSKTLITSYCLYCRHPLLPGLFP